ncbi:nucleotidyltransferase domain-containing protein [Methanoregula sp.]|uniref:nucleotidyltransferase domain-containing protein n=1 Tax=Methanoregula sp. TaxID=2052170 RepID=UPI0026248E9B|nr:nucleotidyltransferase domain-containing protein [Methanoregula sp.]MDD5143760.1 nucleotidyltransferase domain-containing protein [Methanoregula sp.]
MNETPHDLSALFRTGERIALLRAALTVPACSVQQLATKTGLSKGLVSPYLALLEREGLLLRNNRIYTLKNSAWTATVKRFLNIDRVSGAFHKPAWALGTGMYGSWADGTNTDESDLDLWVLCATPPTSILVAEVERTVSRTLSVEVHLLVLTREKMENLKKTDEPFYWSFRKQTIPLEGESPDTS